MSDTEKLIKELSDMSYELNHTIGCMCPDNTFDLIEAAINKIEELSALYEKSLHDCVMESKKNMDDGWIDCKKQLPNKDGVYSCTITQYKDFKEINRWVDDMCFLNGKWVYGCYLGIWNVVAWREKPVVYKGE